MQEPYTNSFLVFSLKEIWWEKCLLMKDYNDNELDFGLAPSPLW